MLNKTKVKRTYFMIIKRCEWNERSFNIPDMNS